jgi:hypothetical protein
MKAHFGQHLDLSATFDKTEGAAPSSISCFTFNNYWMNRQQTG